MKKLLALLGLVAYLVASSALAQGHQSGTFITYPLILVTNTLGFTNLAVPNAHKTNSPYNKYFANGKTNIIGAAGQTITTTATANLVFSNTVNLLRDVPLWARTDGSLATTISGSTNAAVPPETGDGTISVTYRTGASLASPGLTLVFAPVWDGDNVDMNNTWTVGFTATSPSLTAPTTVSTNVPFSKFAGAKALRLVYIWNADATPLNSEAFVDAVRLNGFKGSK